MNIFDRYLFRHLLIATVFTAVTLAGVILLTQSLRFLELVVESGASSGAFWILTMLALPRFFEIILPIALLAATVFVYNRMTVDSELTVMRGLGTSPMRMARPAIVLALLTTLVLWSMTTWLAPKSLASMHHMRQVIKAQYSSLLFKEGVFNSVRPGLTVFVRNRDSEGVLEGLMIHDNRPENDTPVTILAKKGQVVVTDEGQQVVVYDGVRQDINDETGMLNRLNFDRYTIDLPDGSGPVRQRWQEPDERTLWELLNPDPHNERDLENVREFKVEIHRRLISPLLAPAYILIALAFLLLGPVDRRGQGRRIIALITLAIILQGLYLGAFNMARQSNIGLIVMYLVVLCPFGAGFMMLSEYSESWRRAVLFSQKEAKKSVKKRVKA